VIDLEKLFDLMTNSQVKPGTKIAVLGMSTSGHWYSLQVEKTTTQQLVLAAMDSLGDGEHARSSAFLEISQAMNNFINTHQTYKSSELYYNRERMQFDPENCGTFSARFCKRMLKASNFVQGLKDKGNLIPFEGIDLEHADFIRLYSLPANCYFTQYPALGANKDTVLQKMNHQYQCTQQVKGNTIAERFDASELGGLNNNPYYHIYTSVVRLRDKYWQKAIEAYYKRYTPSQLEEILAKRKLANMSLQQLMQLQPDVKKAASSNSNKFDYRNYIAMCKNDGDSAVKPKP
jgi:hypothetical protein